MLAVGIFKTHKEGNSMKIKSSIKSLLVMLVMALALTAAVPAVLPQTHTVEAAKKKKKSAKVNLTISKDYATIKVGKKLTLKVKGNAKKTVKWSTSDKKVVKLSAKKGTKVKVTGLKEGVAVVTAKVGKNKVTAVVFVGKATFADASSKTRKAAGSPLALVGKYLAQHPITIQTGEMNTYASKNGNYSSTGTYTASVVGSNLVIAYTNNYTDNYSESVNDWDYVADANGYEKRVDYTYTYAYQEQTVDSKAIYIPLDGNPLGYYEENITDNDARQRTYNGAPEGHTNYNYTEKSSEKNSATFNIPTLTAGTRVDVNHSYTYQYFNAPNEDGQPHTSTDVYKNRRVSDIKFLVNVLHCLLTDNNTGFKASDLGFTAFHANHKGIGLLTNADFAEYAQQVVAIKADNAAHLDDEDGD